jgi:hypothetical protein
VISTKDEKKSEAEEEEEFQSWKPWMSMMMIVTSFPFVHLFTSICAREEE